MKNIRKLLSLGFLVILFCLFPFLPVEAEEHVVKAGFFEFDGYHMVDESGRRSGYGYDFLQMAASYTDFTYEYVGYNENWSQMQERLSEGSIDILTSAQKTEERLEKYDFTEKSIGKSATILTVKSGNTDYTAGEYKTYDGMRVGMIKNSSRNDSFESFSKKNHFTYEKVFFDDVDEMVEALQDDQIDAIVTSNLRAIQNEWVLDEFDTSDFYLMVQKGNQDLLDQFNTAIDQMDSADPQWRDELYNKYYKQTDGEELFFTGAEQEYLQEEKEQGRVYTFIVNPDRKPYSYFEDGEAKGILPELFSEVARRTGIQYEILETAGRKEYQEQVQSGEVDLVIDGRFAYSEAEDNGYKLTDTYLSTSLGKLVKSSFEGNVKSVAALNFPDINGDYLKKLYQSEDTQYYDSMEECIDAVKSGSADVCYCYSYTAQQAANDDVKNQIVASILPEYAEAFSIGVRSQEDHRLIAVLNKSINSLNYSRNSI